MIATVLAVYGGVALLGTLWLAAFAWRQHRTYDRRHPLYDDATKARIHGGD